MTRQIYINIRRKVIATLLFSFVIGFVYAQDPNVQIGLAEPIYGIKIKNNFPGATRGFARAFMLSNQDASVDFIGLGVYGTAVNGISTLIYGYLGPSYDKPMMTFMPNGNIGIGTRNPGNILTVRGISANNVLLLEQNNGNAMVSVNTENGSPFQDIFQSNGTTIGIHLNSNGNSYFNNGNVAIGTTDPKGYKLAVAGNMIAESVKVKLQGAWPDYVFSKNYVLPTLEETEKHIKENAHLSGIPSAEDVRAKGLDLGDMNAKLLQKIEEMTLQLIDLNKTVKSLQGEVNKLMKK